MVRSRLRKTYRFPILLPSSRRRRNTDFSGITSKDRSRSTRLSSCFGPQSAPTEARTDVAPSVRSCVVFFLKTPVSTGYLKNTQDTYPPSGVLVTVKTTPLFSRVHGTRAYAVRRFKALVNSRFTCRSNSFRLTGSGTNKPVTVTVVPRLRRLVISICERRRHLYLKNNTYLACNFPVATRETTSAIEYKNGAHRCLRRGRCSDSDTLRESA